MKKSFLSIVSLFFLAIGIVKAQSVADGVKDMYARKYKGAKAAFEKILAANPNDVEATYWLGQTLIAMEDVPAAKSLYEKALVASANAPLVIVGMGQVELIEGKINEARQRFEAAITMTGNKKGNDPVILNAVGRAIATVYTVRNKKGDINYAIEKLKEASGQKIKDKRLLAEIYLNLGNAYRRSRPGEAGGEAYQNYQKAIDEDPSFPVPYYQMASLFNSQRNLDLYERYLNETVAADPSFGPAYYDLYYIRLGRRDFAGMQDAAAKYTANSEDPQADHFKAATFWAEKKYDDAIAVSKNIIAKSGPATLARTYSLLADSYLEKGDTAGAKEYIDEYMVKQKPEDITPTNYMMRATIYSAIPGKEDTVLQSYTKAAEADTVLDNKLDFLKRGADYFKTRKMYVRESRLRQRILDLKPEASLTDLFYANVAYYFAGQNEKGREIALEMEQKYPDEVFGFEWAFNNSRAMIDTIDTTIRDSIAVPDALKLLEFSQKDTVKYNKQLVNASLFLVDYYVNYAKDAAKALVYINKAINMDPANESYKNIRDQIEKFIKQSNSGTWNKSRLDNSTQTAVIANSRKQISG